ncbi:FadR/GntR family transcriptional regulator [Pelagibacterium lentulum]|uniref:GntR family transcriptional regulator n=1 Tax=Pelagibacterium lentulum TaxID=2029865 RepID=A0A916RE48_9HYPH|nr:FadR/GntR family transcriptional regulator [Pelagibacterium lentulum]GGA50192.1 GntR family transcriptional regulator [Pelagibacterium lentulum]
MDSALTRQGDAEAKGYDKVFAFVRQQLISGQMKAGDRLVPERELATRLGVGRPVIREVLRALAAIGVIEIRHGYGSVVRRPDFAELGDLFTMMLAQQDEVVEDVMEARIAIERQAIRLACARATSADLAALGEALRRVEKTVNDPQAGGEADFAFHAALIAAAHSPTLASLHAAIAVLLKRSHFERRKRITRLSDIDTYLIEHHRELLAAVVARDADTADRLLVQHFQIGSDYQRRAATEQ